jgi:hypothetical protein
VNTGLVRVELLAVFVSIADEWSGRPDVSSLLSIFVVFILFGLAGSFGVLAVPEDDGDAADQDGGILCLVVLVVVEDARRFIAISLDRNT